MCNNVFSDTVPFSKARRRFCDKCAKKRNTASKRRWYLKNSDLGDAYYKNNRERLLMKSKKRYKTRVRKLKILKILEK